MDCFKQGKVPAALAVILLLAATAGPAVVADETATLHGEIEVADYDDDGNPVSIMVYDTEWGSVLIADGGKGKELRKHVGSYAKLTGTIIEAQDDGYPYTINVSGFSIERDTSDDWDEDD